MSLIERSEALLARSLEDENLWGWPIKLTNLAGDSQNVSGQARNISMLIDMESGTEVQQEQSSVTVRLSSVEIGDPVKGWRAEVTDTSGNLCKTYVVESFPDRTMGIVVLKLGAMDL